LDGLRQAIVPLGQLEVQLRDDGTQAGKRVGAAFLVDEMAHSIQKSTQCNLSQKVPEIVPTSGLLGILMASFFLVLVVFLLEPTREIYHLFKVHYTRVWQIQLCE
jgi:hypothetical protein